MRNHPLPLTPRLLAAALALAAAVAGAAPVSGAATASTDAASAPERAPAASEALPRHGTAAGRSLDDGAVGRTSTGNRNLDLLLELQQFRQGAPAASTPAGRAASAVPGQAARARAGADAVPEDEEIRVNGRADTSGSSEPQSRKWVSEVGSNAGFSAPGRGGESSSSGGGVGEGYVDPYDYSFLKHLIPRWLYASLRENRDLVIGIGVAVLMVSAWLSSRARRRPKAGKR